MDTWINRLLMGCGGVAGLLLATEHFGEAAALVTFALCGVGLMRTRALASPEES